jgi:hypothetical protein
MSTKKEINYAEELKREYARWEHYRVFGGRDPFWPDGSNMNIIRNHIIHDRRKIEEHFTPDNYPEIYYKEIPPEMDNDYMARPDEIRAAAIRSLKMYESNPDYQYIKSRRHDFTPKTLEKIPLGNILNYAAGLKRAIESDDLVTMRRHEKQDTYLDSFRSCAEKMKALPAEEIQVTFDSFFSHQSYESEEEPEIEE